MIVMCKMKLHISRIFMLLKLKMKSILFSLLITCCIYSSAQKKNVLIPAQINLPNGWSLTPVGKSLPLGDLPLNIAVSKTKKIIQEDTLGAEAYTCLLSHDKKELYISVWGGDKIKIFNTSTKKLTDSIAVGDNPNDMCLSKNGEYLYVANANDNSVSVIN